VFHLADGDAMVSPSWESRYFPGDEPDRAGVRVTVISAFDVSIAVLS
jgi:hypothetical protein